MNKKYSLLLAASLITNNAAAQNTNCVVQPTCSQLGYTKTVSNCNLFGLSYVKCPFDQSVVACIENLPSSTTAKAACEAAGYKYTSAQCGKKQSQQIGIRCPYSSSYYYCESPNQNAQAGWYLCEDGTVASSSCPSGYQKVGVVLKAPTTRRKGLAVITFTIPNTYNGSNAVDLLYQCNALNQNDYLKGIGYIREPVLGDLKGQMSSSAWSKVKSEIQSKGVAIGNTVWVKPCFTGNNQTHCFGSDGNYYIQSQGLKTVCVVDL